MRWTAQSIQTLRDNPAEAKSPVHALLGRAGYLRIPAPGVYEWTALGQRSLDRIRMTAPENCGIRIAGENRAFSEFGADPAIHCPNCGYIAGLDEALSIPAPPPIPDPETDAAPEPFHTPDKKTIADIADFTGLPRTSQMKSLVMIANGKPILALVRGDHHLSRPKLARFVGAAEARPALPEEIRTLFGADPGSLGPLVRESEAAPAIRIVTDNALRGRRNMITGANRNDYHLRNVTPLRDFETEFADLRQAAETDACIKCGSALDLRKTTLLTTPEAILLTAAEQNSDELGLKLPAAIAPFALLITPVNNGDPAMRAAAEKIYQESESSGIEALYDDRDERPGVKFKDADLIGIPWRVTIGKRLAQGMVELTDRRARTSRDLPPSEVVAALSGALLSVRPPKP